MPIYEYSCDKCELNYEEFRFMYEEGPQCCPNCESSPPDFHQVYDGGRQVGMVKGEPKTFGQQAEENAKRMGKEQMEKFWEQEAAKRQGFHGKIPSNGRVIKKEPKIPPWRDGSMTGEKLEKPLDLNTIKNIDKYIETGEK